MRAGAAPNAAPIGTRDTEMIEEFTGFRTEPRIIGASSLRSKAACGPAPSAARRGRSSRPNRVSGAGSDVPAVISSMPPR
ncbi:hypothetical protein GCM10025734_10880 [Kitasatospora paranensis]